VGVGARNGDGVGLRLGGEKFGAATPSSVCLLEVWGGGATAGGSDLLGGETTGRSLGATSARVGSWSLSKM
jgi:hypothetical protein